MNTNNTTNTNVVDVVFCDCIVSSVTVCGCGCGCDCGCGCGCGGGCGCDRFITDVSNVDGSGLLFSRGGSSASTSATLLWPQKCSNNHCIDDQ
jgi:hypothetical protein